MRRFCISGLMVSLLSFGCGGDDAGGGKDPEDTIDLIADELLKQRDAVCECADEPGSQLSLDPGDCEGTPSSSSWSRCVLRALDDDDDETDVGKFLSCYLKIEKDFSRCIARDACGSEAEDCLETYRKSQEKCATFLSDAAAEALDEC